MDPEMFRNSPAECAGGYANDVYGILRIVRAMHPTMKATVSKPFTVDDPSRVTGGDLGVHRPYSASFRRNDHALRS